MHHAVPRASPHLTANQPSSAGGKCSPSQNDAGETEGETVNCSCRDQPCHLSLICCLLLEILLSWSVTSHVQLHSYRNYLVSYQQSLSVRKCIWQMTGLKAPCCAYEFCSNFYSLSTLLTGMSSLYVNNSCTLWKRFVADAVQ